MFHRGLKDSGYVEGESVTIIYRGAEGQNDRLPALAAELVRRQVSVIVAFGSAAFAAKSATTEIPIVFGVNEDKRRLREGKNSSLCYEAANVIKMSVRKNDEINAVERNARTLEVGLELPEVARSSTKFFTPSAIDEDPFASRIDNESMDGALDGCRHEIRLEHGGEFGFRDVRSEERSDSNASKAVRDYGRLELTNLETIKAVTVWRAVIGLLRGLRARGR